MTDLLINTGLPLWTTNTQYQSINTNTIHPNANITLNLSTLKLLPYNYYLKTTITALILENLKTTRNTGG